MIYNTEENRQKFVDRFGFNHNRYPVDTETANKILGAFDNDLVRMSDEKNLWSFIMQDRVSYMLGEQYFLGYYEQGKKVTKRIRAKAFAKVTSEIYNFIEGLEK